MYTFTSCSCVFKNTLESLKLILLSHNPPYELTLQLWLKTVLSSNPNPRASQYRRYRSKRQHSSNRSVFCWHACTSLVHNYYTYSYRLSNDTNIRGRANLPVVSVYTTTFYSFARLLSALYCHGYSKFGSGPWCCCCC